MSEDPFALPVQSVELVLPEQTESGEMAIIALERIEPGITPAYVVYGKVTCYGCDEWCWLGNVTFQLIQSGSAAGLCLECVAEKLPDLEPVCNLQDER